MITDTQMKFLGWWWSFFAVNLRVIKVKRFSQESRDRQTHKQTNRQMDGHYQIYYLPSLLKRVDNDLSKYNLCCGQLWVWHMVCGQTCDGLYNFAFYLVNSGIPFGSQPIKSAWARHTGVQVPVVPAKWVTWSLRVYMGCALALIFQVRSLNIPCNMVHFQGSISGSP